MHIEPSHSKEKALQMVHGAAVAELKRVAPLMLHEWSDTKKAPRHADWLHVDPDKQG